jgi:DNA-binding transcriptional MerR regulator
MPTRSRDRRTDYFKSAEVAELIGVTKQTLLNWLRRGLITEPERNPATGYRLWTEKDIERIRRFLREREQ